MRGQYGCLPLVRMDSRRAATTGNYALDPHYQLPYVQAWNLDVQKTLPWGVVVNVGYNGSKGNHLDVTSAPRASASSPGTDPDGPDFHL